MHDGLGKVLVTGASSGFGKHCVERFNATTYSRKTTAAEIAANAKAEPYDVIIHAAFNTKPIIDTSQLYAYLNDTLFLTQRLTTIPHKRFIFISSVDVYPKDSYAHHEDEVIHLKDTSNIYAVSKLMSESIVLNEANDPLILRPTAMLGPDAKPNSLIKILSHERVSLTLSGQSVFNFIRHVDLSDFIVTALKSNLSGIYNTAASSSIQLAEVSRHFDKPVSFGSYTYQTANADNHKAVAILSNFKNTSMENINLYMQDMSLAV